MTLNSRPSTLDAEPSAIQVRRRRWFALALLLGCLVWAGGMGIAGRHYIFERQYDVDEFLAVQNARLLATGDGRSIPGASHTPPVELMYLHLVPLSWLVERFDGSLSIMSAARVAFFALLVLNLLLIALVQPYFTTWQGRFLVLVGASLLYPFWKNGTEIRQENLLLLTQIVVYGVMQQLVRQPAGARAQQSCNRLLLALAAMMMVWTVMSVPKSLLYLGPYAIGLLALASPLRRDTKSDVRDWQSVARALAWLAAGAFLGLLAAFAMLFASGQVDSHLEMWGWYYRKAAEVPRFSATPLLNSTVQQMPHVVALAFCFLLLCVFQAWRPRRLPEARDVSTGCCLLLSVAAVYINPVPFRYNYVHFALFSYLAALGTLSMVQGNPAAVKPAAADRFPSAQVMVLMAFVLVGIAPETIWTQYSLKLLAGQLLLFVLTLQLVNHRGSSTWLFAASGAVCMWMQLHVYNSTIHWIAYTVILALVARFRPTGHAGDSPHRLCAAYVIGALSSFVGTAVYLAVSGELARFLKGEGHWLAFSWRDHEVGPTVSVMAIAACGAVAWWMLQRSQGSVIEASIPAAYVLAELIASLFSPLLLEFSSLHFWVFVGLWVMLRLRFMLANTRVLWRVVLATGYAASVCVLARTWATDVRDLPGNEYQKEYILAAESLTDPQTDPVLDGVGMVVSRGVPGPHWYLDSAWLPHYKAGRRTTFREMMRHEPPPPVVITNYRWQWLGPEEWDVLNSRYLQLASQLRVLGGEIPQSEGTFTVHRSGRYRIEPILGDPDEASDTLQVNETFVGSGRVLRLQAGTQTFVAGPPRGFRYFWVGPTLENAPVIDDLPPGILLLKSGW